MSACPPAAGDYVRVKRPRGYIWLRVMSGSGMRGEVVSDYPSQFPRKGAVIGYVMGAVVSVLTAAEYRRNVE